MGNESRRDLSLIGLSGDVSVEQLIRAIREERGEVRPDAPGKIFREFIKITSFEEYAEASRKLHQDHSAILGSVLDHAKLACQDLLAEEPPAPAAPAGCKP